MFSLAKQLEVDPFFFEEETPPPESSPVPSPREPTERGPLWRGPSMGPSYGEAQGLKALSSAVMMLEKELGILSATDLVLNHAANSSEWLVEHPEVG